MKQRIDRRSLTRKSALVESAASGPVSLEIPSITQSRLDLEVRDIISKFKRHDGVAYTHVMKNMFAVRSTLSIMGKRLGRMLGLSFSPDVENLPQRVVVLKIIRVSDASD